MHRPNWDYTHELLKFKQPLSTKLNSKHVAEKNNAKTNNSYINIVKHCKRSTVILQQKNSPQSTSNVLPSLQYSTPSQVAVGGRHMPSSHLSELFARQPTDCAKKIMQDTISNYIVNIYVVQNSRPNYYTEIVVPVNCRQTKCWVYSDIIQHNSDPPVGYLGMVHPQSLLKIGSWRWHIFPLHSKAAFTPG